eukprot:CAMPEP_0114978266 /NCGR_PEP_ID=MMETSP0216-20121206/3710_1 /TAXON_ID=223996 /ORGANISM="Protocruzia adherens, Strain Boccale" /LENGTH=1788 /DNA_ID=CAMNT_0002339441 /DNA_START=180 /DNA_END=5546 /DNA_ORIENTATION=-
MEESSALKRNVANLLSTFDRNREWADITNWLQKLQRTLTKYPDSRIPEKASLAKRLAQCLNPVLPHGVHMNTLEIYRIIFLRLNPPEVVPNRNGDDFDSINQSEGYWGSDLALWSSGLFPFFQHASFQVKPQFLDLIERYYLHRGDELITCISAFVICIIPGLDDRDENITVRVKKILDQTCDVIGTKAVMGAVWMALLRTPKVRQPALIYLKEKLPTYAPSFDSEKATNHDIDYSLYHSLLPNRSTLVISAIVAAMEDENALVKRGVLDLLISHFPILEQIFTESEKIEILEGALHLIVRRDAQIIRRVYMWLHYSPDDDIKDTPPEAKASLKFLLSAVKNIFEYFEPTNEKDAMKPIKMLWPFMTEVSYLAEPMLDVLAINIIGYAAKYYKKHGQGTLSILKDLLGEALVTNPGVNLWRALGQILSQSLSHIRASQALESIELIRFTLNELKSVWTEANVILNISVYLSPILSRLLLSMERLSGNFRSLEATHHALELVLEILHNMIQNENELFSDQVTDDTFSSLEDGIEAFNNFFIDLCEKYEEELGAIGIPEQPHVDIDKVYASVHLSAKVVVQIQQLSRDISKSQHGQEFNPQPKWLDRILGFIESHQESIALIGIETLLELAILEKDRRRKQSYPAHYRRMMTRRSTGGLTEETFATKLEVAIKRLWVLVGNAKEIRKVIDLMERYYGYDEDLFARVITSTLNFGEPTFEMKMDFIRRFTRFWKLMGDLYPSHTLFMDGRALFMVIDFLEDEYTAVRHATRSWINETKSSLSRIIDPLLISLLGPINNLYRTDKDQYFYFEYFDTKRIQICFKMLRSILINAHEVVLKYLGQAPLSGRMKEEVQKVHFESIQRVEGSYYLELLLEMALKYIQGQALESFSNDQMKDFHLGNAAVNAASCDLIELLISYVEPLQSSRIVKVVLDPVVNLIRHSINNKDDVIQVHLLSVLKNIFFNQNFKTDENLGEIAKVFLRSDKFIMIILEGMISEQFYLQSNWVYFSILCLPYITDMMKNSNQSSQIIRQMIGTLCQLIRSYSTYYNRPKSDDRVTTHDSVFTETIDVSFLFGALGKILHHSFDPKHIERAPNSQSRSGLMDRWKDIFSSSNFSENSLIGAALLQSPLTKEVIKEFDNIIYACSTCWHSVERAHIHTKLCRHGTLPFTRLAVPKDFEEMICSVEDAKYDVINLLRPMVVQFPHEVLKAVLNQWIRGEGDSSQLTRTAEILINLDLTIDLFLTSLNKLAPSILLPDRSRKQKGGSRMEVEREAGVREAALCHVLYTQIAYLLNRMIERTPVAATWKAAIKFCKLLEHSKHPSTQLWLLEIINVLSERMSIRELAISDRKTTKELQEVTNNLTVKISQVISGNYQTVCNDPKDIFPYPPHVFKIYLQEKNLMDPNHNYHEVVKPMLDADQTFDFFEMPDENARNRTHALIVFRDILFPLVQRVWLEDVKVAQQISSIMPSLLSILQNRSEGNMPFFEYASSALSALLNESQDLIRLVKRDLLDIFYSSEFFMMTQQSLTLWCGIINCYIHNDRGDITNEILTKVNSGGGLFAVKDSEKVKYLKRLAYVLYSSDEDFCEQRLPAIAERVGECIRAQDSPEIFSIGMFLLRILCLQLRGDSACELLRNLGPTINSELQKIFRNYEETPMSIRIAAIKLIEFLSILQVEEFYLHKWMYLYDVFGLNMCRRSPESLHKGKFEPYLAKQVIPEDHEFSVMNETPKPRRNDQLKRRRLQLKPHEIEDSVIPRTIALVQYVSLNNELHTELDLNNLKEMLEQEFLELE